MEMTEGLWRLGCVDIGRLLDKRSLGLAATECHLHNLEVLWEKKKTVVAAALVSRGAYVCEDQL